MTKEEIIKKVLEYFEDNEEDFIDAIEELDSWNGYLNDERIYFMDDLDEIFYRESPIYILERAFFGHDDDNWTTDSRGDRTYGEFNPNREFFYFNGYGNLVSTDYKDYSSHLDEWFAEIYMDEAVDHNFYSFPDELEELKEEWEVAE